MGKDEDSAKQVKHSEDPASLEQREGGGRIYFVTFVMPAAT